eukprot:m.88330 g.88330  ORF g.88330 m.88330 type:complete len:219 (-) comp11633_c0_seq2:76-732(-)
MGEPVTPRADRGVTVVMTPEQLIDVKECLRNVNVLLGSPIRSGQQIDIRLSLCPPGASSTDVDSAESQCAMDSRQCAGGRGILNITVELLLHILSYVPPESLGRLRRVCRGWKLIVDTHKEFLFKPLCIANGWRSPLIVNIPEIREVREDTDSETGTEDAQSANQAQWSRIFITNYYATKSWANKRDTCSSPWRDDKATPFQFDTDTWGRLLEVSCAF